MAIQDGIIKFTGSIKGIRNFKRLHDPKIYASEKGDLSRKTVMTHPNFANTRLSICEFTGCAKAVKGIRRGFYHLIPEMVDDGFTARLMKFTRELSSMDVDGKKGQRSYLFSAYRSSLKALVFNKKRKAIESAMISLKGSHSDSRMETTLEVKDLTMRSTDLPSGAERYRVLSHLSIVSDYHYSEDTKCYEPTNPLDGLSAFAYSDYASPGVAFTTELVVAFPEGIVIGEDSTIVHCVAIESFVSGGISGMQPIYGPSLAMMDVF
jgi:hypothetical protein